MEGKRRKGLKEQHLIVWYINRHLTPSVSLAGWGIHRESGFIWNTMQRSHGLVWAVYKENEDMLSLARTGTCPWQQITQRTTAWRCEGARCKKAKAICPRLIWIQHCVHCDSDYQALNFAFPGSGIAACWGGFYLPGLAFGPQLTSFLTAKNNFLHQNTQSYKYPGHKLAACPTFRNAWCLYACPPAASSEENAATPKNFKIQYALGEAEFRVDSLKVLLHRTNSELWSFCIVWLNNS